jgi:cell division protein FtsL
MKKPIYLIGILITIIISLFVVKTFVSNRISTSGVQLGYTQEKIAEYKTQNAILHEKVYAQSSLTYLSQKAEKKGFVQSKTTFAVSQGLPLARK